MKSINENGTQRETFNYIQDTEQDDMERQPLIANPPIRHKSTCEYDHKLKALKSFDLNLPLKHKNT